MINNTKLIKTLVFLLCLSPFFVHAGGSSGNREVHAVKIEGNEFVAIYPKNSSWEDPDNCSNGTASVLMIPTYQPEYKSKYSMAMMAMANNSSLSAWVIGCAQTPWGFKAPIVHTLTVFN